MAAEGQPIEIPDFGLDFEAEMAWAEENIFQKYKGRLVRFPVGDGYAIYVVNDDKKHLHHVPYADAYQVHPAMIRGLLPSDIENLLNQERRMAEIFGEASAL